MNKSLQYAIVTYSRQEWKVLAGMLKSLKIQSRNVQYFASLADVYTYYQQESHALMVLCAVTSANVTSLELWRRQAAKIPGTTALVALIANEEAHLGSRALEMGAHDYLLKGSFDAPYLEKTIRFVTERQRFRDLVNKSEQKFQALIDNNFDAFLIQDEETKILDVSPSIENLSGYKREDVIGLSAPDFIHKDDLAPALEEFQKVVKGEQRQARFKERARVNDGSFVWIEVIVTDCRQVPGIHAFVSNIRNVDKEVRVLEDLKIQKERLQKALRLSKMGYWWFDLQSFELVWSQEVYDLYGLEPETFELNFGSYLELVHPDDRHLFTPESFKNLEGIEQDALEYRVLRSDGRYIWLRGTASLVESPNSKASIVEGAVQDITDRKLSQLQLEERENRLRLFMENSPALSWLKDAEGRVLAANERFMIATGRTEEDIGKKPEDLANEPAPETRENDLEVLRLQKPVHLMEKVPNPQGEIRTYEVYKFPVQAHDEVLLGGFALDVTDKLNYLNAIEKQNEKLREIAWVQSHVVRAPLVRMMGLMGLLKNHDLEPKEQEDVLQKLNSSAEELDQVISEMIRNSTEVKTKSMYA